MAWKTVLTGIGCLIAGASGTRAWMHFNPTQAESSSTLARHGPESQRPAPAAAEPRRGTGVNLGAAQAALVQSLVRQEVAAAVEQGMARAAASAADTPAEATPDDAAEIEAAAEPTPSYTRAQAYVGQRIARGSWTEQDRDALSAEIDGMTVRERRDVMAQLIRATNQDKLRLELRGPLF